MCIVKITQYIHSRAASDFLFVFGGRFIRLLSL